MNSNISDFNELRSIQKQFDASIPSLDTFSESTMNQLLSRLDGKIMEIVRSRGGVPDLETTVIRQNLRDRATELTKEATLLTTGSILSGGSTFVSMPYKAKEFDNRFETFMNQCHEFIQEYSHTNEEDSKSNANRLLNQLCREMNALNQIVQNPTTTDDMKKQLTEKLRVASERFEELNQTWLAMLQMREEADPGGGKLA